MAKADFVVVHGTTVNETATFNSTTDATSTTVAALTVAGGVGIAKKLIVGSTISATQLTSTIATGTAPFVVTSTTPVANLSIGGNAATVTTNANLTGVITSVGNLTSIASQTGTGTKFVVDTSPTLVTPTLGVATATSINGLIISSSTGTLTVANLKTFAVNNSITLAGTDSTTITLPSTSGTVALNNQTMYIGTTSLAINRTSLAQTLSGVSIDGNAATVTTNANLTGVITSVGNATSIASQTGTGTKIVVDTSPTLVTPTLGVATATSINKVAISTPANSATITISDQKTLTVTNTLTLSGTDTSSIAFGAGGTVVYAASGLSQFTANSTTSAQLATVMSDETGSGKLVFDTSPAFTTSITTGSTSFDLINTTATSVNFAKAATALSIGATTGSTTINNDLVVSGNLTVSGITTTVNSTTVTVTDKNIELGKVTTPTDVTANGGGITLKGATDKTFNWTSTENRWSSNVGLQTNNPALGGTLGSQEIAVRFFSTYNTNGGGIDISHFRDAVGSDWTTVGTRIQQKIDATWMAWQQFNGNGNPQGIAWGTGNSTASAQAVPEIMRLDLNGNLGIGHTNPSNWYSLSARLLVNQSQNAETILGIGNPTVGASASASLRMIGGTANSYSIDRLNDANGAPWMQHELGSGVTYRSWTMGGTEKLRLNTNGLYVYGSALEARAVNNSTRLRSINSSSESTRYPGYEVLHYSGNLAGTADNGGFPVLELMRSRGTEATKLAVQTNDTLGSITGWGWNTSAYDDVARINFVADNTFTTSDARGRIDFQTQTGTTLSTVMTIAATTLTIGVAGTTTTTLNGTVNLPNVGTSGFVKLGTGGQLSADTSTYALNNQTMYIGTTAVAINRTSGNLALTGITSIDGTAAGLSATLGVSSGGTGLTSPGTSGNLLTSNGTSWVSSPAPISLPTQTGNNGKFLTTDGTTATWTTIGASSFSATGTKDSTTYLAGDNTWKSTLLETTYTPTITGSGAIAITIDFSTVNSTTILIPLISGVTGATITFTNLNSKAISNTIFSFNVVLSHVTALSSTTAIVWKFGASLNPKWTGNIIPPSTVTAAAIDIWTFFTYDSGSSLVGSLSMADVRNA